MTIQFHTTIKNARADAVEEEIGTDPVLKIRTGAAPTNVTDADTGTVLATITLPTDWMAAAASGAKAKSGTWQDLEADAGGDAAHFRIYDSGGVCRMQGSVSELGGGGDMIVNEATVVANQQFRITAFGWTEGN